MRGNPGFGSWLSSSTKVYPRACGGTVIQRVGGYFKRGLSPRVRRNRRRLGRERVVHGSIPARAGEPQRRRARAGPLGVYPRACGGTLHRETGISPIVGLSPRVRGNLLSPHRIPEEMRSIPARAGEPCWPTALTCATKVYPRACGGTIAFDPDTRVLTGLSPRVRGNRVFSNNTLLLLRSIPARAGEPQRSSLTPWGCPVYPRACGGTRLSDGGGNSNAGLSPRVRGNRRPALWVPNR